MQYRAPDGRLFPHSNPFEMLRRIWTPGREIEEVIHKLDPSTELDSIIRDFFCRLMEQKVQKVTLDLDQPNTGDLRWEIVMDGSGRRQVSIWWIPDEQKEIQ